MKVTKFGHCCLLIEEQGVKILTDPGMYTTAQDQIQGVDFVVITHEHGDHLHLDSVQSILRNNPGVKIISNSAVKMILEKAGITSEIVEHGQQKQLGDVLLEGFGSKHAEIFQEYGQVLNTGYFFNDKLFYPGDSLYNPGKPVEVLAFPTTGSWANTKESITYVLDVMPKKCFPVHDGNFKSHAFLYNTYGSIIPKHGIEFIDPSKSGFFEI